MHLVSTDENALLALTSDTMFRIVNLGLMVSGSAALVYLLDTHGANALHIISLMCFFKQMISYSATFYANGIVESKGVTTSLYILAACQGVCWLATIPMYIFGKRARSFVRSETLFNTHSDTDVMFFADRSAPKALLGISCITTLFHCGNELDVIELEGPSVSYL